MAGQSYASNLAGPWEGPHGVGHNTLLRGPRVRTDKQRIVPERPGGLNGSTQHSARTHLALKTRAKIAREVRSVGTLPWLGFDRVQPNRSVLQGEYCRIN